jgi:hypothetical protein
MAKGILEYDLSNPDDMVSYLRAVKSLDMALILWDMEQYLRSQLKYNEQLSDEEYKTFQKVKEKLIQLMLQYNVSIDEILN